jgi:hypothetical protein
VHYSCHPPPLLSMGFLQAVQYSTAHKRGRVSTAVYIIMSMVYPRTIGHYHVNLLSWEGCTVGMENWPILSLYFSLHFKRGKNSCGFLFEIEKMPLFSSLASISFNSIRKCTGTFWIGYKKLLKVLQRSYWIHVTQQLQQKHDLKDF